MPFYEIVYVTRADLSAGEVDSLTDSFAKILEENGGKLVSREYWGLRVLAYKIKKNSMGHYVLMNVNSPHGAVEELARLMGFNENLIRKGIFAVDRFSSAGSELAISENARDYGNSINSDRVVTEAAN
ncbi:MAG: 30S ribosomal protein S6 [Rickettsiales bacterium]|jgi:small subunit ribosomal protein S6|nr:30S ribosomal protein S6 [Rickettsiales bacterium]